MVCPPFACASQATSRILPLLGDAKAPLGSLIDQEVYSTAPAAQLLTV